ncbi:hypothetical protein V8C37DRAFT_386141 [Trichoderma ceciliae]
MKIHVWRPILACSKVYMYLAQVPGRCGEGAAIPVGTTRTNSRAISRDTEDACNGWHYNTALPVSNLHVHKAEHPYLYKQTRRNSSTECTLWQMEHLILYFLLPATSRQNHQAAAKGIYLISEHNRLHIYRLTISSPGPLMVMKCLWLFQGISYFVPAYLSKSLAQSAPRLAAGREICPPCCLPADGLLFMPPTICRNGLLVCVSGARWQTLKLTMAPYDLSTGSGTRTNGCNK